MWLKKNCLTKEGGKRGRGKEFITLALKKQDAFDNILNKDRRNRIWNKVTAARERERDGGRMRCQVDRYIHFFHVSRFARKTLGFFCTAEGHC